MHDIYDPDNVFKSTDSKEDDNDEQETQPPENNPITKDGESASPDTDKYEQEHTHKFEQEIIYMSEQEASENKKLFSKKKKKLMIISAILAAVIVVAGIGTIYVGIKLGKLNTGGDTDSSAFDDEIYEDSDFSTIDADLNATNFKDSIKEWATNGGEIMSSKNVINVVVIGYDARSNTLSGNTDAIMLVSLNKKTKKITLSSFLRDTYVYYETDNGRTGFNKINALCSIDGAQCLMKAIENHYKISVDNYVALNFTVFEKLVNEMGGVNVTVQKYESNYFNSYFKESIPYGESVLLNGFQALGFCRIRKCDADGDVSRVRRQQDVVRAIIGKVSEASVTEIDDYIDVILPYISTDLKNQEIVSLATKAILMKWYAYEIQNMQIPTEESRYGYSGSTWIWATDFPLSAQALQMAIYGQTNIELTEGRRTIINILRGSKVGTGSSSAKAKPSTTGGADGKKETTTIPTTAEESTEPLTSESTEPLSTNEVSEPKQTEPPSSNEVSEPPSSNEVSEPEAGANTPA